MAEHQTQLTTFFEASRVLMFEAKISGRFSVVNRTWCAMLGYTVSEASQITLNDTIHPASRQQFSILFYRLLAGRSIVADLTLQSKTGSAIEVTGALTCVFDGETPASVQGVLHEIGHSRQSDHQLKKFFDLSMDMFCTATFDGHFKLINPAFERTLGFTREELMSRSFVEFVHPDDQEATVDELAALGKGRPALFFENRYRCRDGSYRTLSWTATPGNDEVYAVARDITEIKHAEDELKRTKDEAEAANRAKSRFLANMSHELRTPLNSVIGFTSVLLKNQGQHVPARELDYLKRIRSNGVQLLTLINDILDLSKIEAGRLDVQLQDVSLGPLVSEVLAEIAGNVDPKKLTLNTVVPADTALLTADRDKLKQVLINLVGNAVKFTERGTVTVSVTTRAHTPNRIEVADTGIGIPQERLEAIFNPFEQAEDSTTRRFGGTGLGLAISRLLCDAMGFRLSATSEEGVGSIFAIDVASDAMEPDGRSDRLPTVDRRPIPAEIAS